MIIFFTSKFCITMPHNNHLQDCLYFLEIHSSIKEGSGRDKSTQNVVNNERSVVERGVAKFDASQGEVGSHRIWTHLFQPCPFHSSLHFVYSYLFQIPPFQ